MADKEKFKVFIERMQQEGLPEILIRNFRHQYTQLLAGATGLIPERDILPVDNLPDAETFDTDLVAAGREAVGRTVVIKLNGGLGTSMGLNRAKSLIRIKDGQTFLDVVARQAQINQTPLLLMNSFATRSDSLEALKQYPDLQKYGLDADFVQHKVPKIRQEDLMPVEWPEAPGLEWNPPGHGDLYIALLTSGMLEKLLDAGFQYAFVSNSDNLGAVLDEAILGYLAEQDAPFLMEVADRTPADRKGGHLAQKPDGQLILRESAQCPEAEMDNFQDIGRYRFFNTNSLWLNLRHVRETLTANDNVLDLPIIRNRKTVDPRSPDSTPVYQLETAMGSAISVFPGAQAVRVPRTRFAPVKTTDDLLVIRSDAYELTNDFRLVPAVEPATLPVVSLDKTCFGIIDDFERRFPEGAPSLRGCRSLTVEGDFRFSAGVEVRGKVKLRNHRGGQVLIEPGTVLDQDLTVD